MKYIIKEKYLLVNFSGVDILVFAAPVKDILPIYYVSVRGVNDEVGAVQRVLNRRRISSIADFVLEGNDFFNTFIFNWVDKNYPICIDQEILKIPIVPNAAQVIDGQHRLEGIKKAYEEDPSVGEKDILIIMAESLKTEDAARIFLNINSEQKPVPKSLVYDLFGEIKGKDYHIVRATDIAKELHEDKESPYYQCIKLPGAKKGTGRVDLSAVVNSLKPYTLDDGVFKQYNLGDYETQYRIIFNLTSALRDFYDKDGDWLKNTNPFMTNAGFFSLIEFLCKDLLPKCVEKKSFEINTIKGLIPLHEEGLLLRSDLKNMQGKEQRVVVYKYLKGALLREVPNKDEYRF